MSYVHAEEVLPKELIETIQQYISGKNIYIPCKEKKAWGSSTKTKEQYQARNREKTVHTQIEKTGCRGNPFFISD